MTRNSSSPSSNDRPWLDEKVYHKKKQRTFEFVKKAVDALVAKGLDVTVSSVSKMTKELDPDGDGVHPNTIKTNKEAHAYYAAHSITYRQTASRKNRRRPSKKKEDIATFENIKLDRDLNSVRKRYMRLSKSELIDRLIQAEQHIAERQNEWLIDQFKLFE